MASQLPITTSPRAKKDWQILTRKALDNALRNYHYIKIEKGKTGNLHLTGAPRMFVEHPTMIYNPTWRLAGTPEAITEYMAFQKTDKDAIDSPLREVSVAVVLAPDASYTKANFEVNKVSIQKEITAYEKHRKDIKASSSISLEDASALLRASGGLGGIKSRTAPGPTGAAGAKKRTSHKVGETLKVKVENLLKGNTSHPESPQVYDVSKLTDKGTGIRRYYLQGTDARFKPKLPKSRYYVDGLPIAATLDAAGRLGYARAVQQLTAQGMDGTNLAGYLANFDQKLGTVAQAAPVVGQAGIIQLQNAAPPILATGQKLLQPI
uniref:Uncharacterized protein n=1 Tax=Pithovirus LCPAC202 TaxID=2506592 RepID=A0A481Z5E8_9VIRU|nr:MAG: uncharacterized protein LCPAC202_00970 [Pithovirus LCPAC202]